MKTTVCTKAVFGEDGCVPKISLSYRRHYVHRHEVVPIAMGARSEDYERQAPYRSYIHVDQFAGGGQEGGEGGTYLPS